LFEPLGELRVVLDPILEVVIVPVTCGQDSLSRFCLMFQTITVTPVRPMRVAIPPTPHPNRRPAIRVGSVVIICISLGC
jgi:hypothetical protein